MYRTVYYLGLVVAVFSILGLAVPHSFTLLTFLFPNGLYAVISLVLSFVLMHFAIASYFRKPKYRTWFAIIGVLSILIALVGLFSPNYFGLQRSYVRPANELMILLSGFGYVIAALEYKRPSLAEELGFKKIRKMYKEHTWKLILGMKLTPEDQGKLTHKSN